MGQGSSTNVVNKTLNDVALKVLITNANKTTSVINQGNVIVLSNTKNSNFKDIVQKNTGTINATSIQSAIQTQNLQSDLIAELKNTIKQEDGIFNVAKSQEANLDNIVSNSVKSHVNLENINNIKSIVEQDNKIIATHVETITARDILQENEATMIIELVSTMTSDIVAKLKNNSMIQTDIEQKSQGLLGAIFGDFFSNLGFIGGLAFIAFLLVGAYLSKEFIYRFSDYKVFVPIVILILSLILIDYFFFNDDSDDNESKENEVKNNEIKENFNVVMYGPRKDL
jgi:hypothetical protein